VEGFDEFSMNKEGKKMAESSFRWTSGINNEIADNAEFAKFFMTCLERHGRGDWGDLSEQDRQSNEDALRDGERLFSVYNFMGPLIHSQSESKIYIVTEADRAGTMVLFPCEY
jgi:hypothetical protein